MTIVRDGHRYELTETELDQAYRECKHYYFMQDVITKAEDLDVILSDQVIDEIAHDAEENLNNCDCFWEDYWMAVEQAIENYVKM